MIAMYRLCIHHIINRCPLGEVSVGDQWNAASSPIPDAEVIIAYSRHHGTQ
jgi:hypothetical protein